MPPVTVLPSWYMTFFLLKHLHKSPSLEQLRRQVYKKNMDRKKRNDPERRFQICLHRRRKKKPLERNWEGWGNCEKDTWEDRGNWPMPSLESSSLTYEWTNERINELTRDVNEGANQGNEWVLECWHAWMHHWTNIRIRERICEFQNNAWILE